MPTESSSKFNFTGTGGGSDADAKKETAADDNKAKERIGDRTELDSSELNDIIRESMDRVDPDKEVEKEKAKVDNRETVVTDEERKEEKKTDRGDDDRINKVLSRLETAERRLEEYEKGGRRTEREAPKELEGFKMVAIAPGVDVYLPEKREHYPIKLTKDLVKAVGLDETATDGLEKLANVFYFFMAETIPNIALKKFDDTTGARTAGEKRRSKFEEDYPDLKEWTDLAVTVERNLRNDEPLVHDLTREGRYEKELAKRVRTRLATMRGVSLDEYERDLTKTGGSSGSERRSRAVTTSGGNSGRSSGKTDTNTKELNDML